jgi:hypothetical protein
MHQRAESTDDAALLRDYGERLDHPSGGAPEHLNILALRPHRERRKLLIIII